MTPGRGSGALRILRAPWAWVATLALLFTVLAVGTHRSNIDYGDDFALYLRQAQAVMDGDVGRVVDANATMLRVDPGQPYAFSPTAYPWVTPLFFAPFVQLFGPTNWAALRLVVVGLMVLWIVAFTFLLRRRLPPPVAVLVAASVALALPYVAGTNSLLSEVPYLLVSTLFLLLLDRQSAHLLHPSWGQAWVTGAAACLVFNTRREGLAAVVAIAAMQLVASRRGAARFTAASARPYLSFAGAVIAFQALLPSALFPRYAGAGLGVAARKLWGPFRHAFSGLLGLGSGTTAAGTALILLAVLGVVLRLRKGEDVAIIAFVAASTVIAASHPAMDPRYMMLATPFVLAFAAVGMCWVGERLAAPTWRLAVPLVLLGALAAHGAIDSGQRVLETRRANAAHEYLLGPGDPAEDEAIQAVRDHTAHRDVVAFFKARALTYLTDRPAIQTADLDTLLQEADYYLQRYDHFTGPSGFSPFLGLLVLSDDDAAALGLTEVWRNDRWVLWRLPEPALPEG